MSDGIPQRARRSESVTGAEALIDLFVSPVANKPAANSGGSMRINVKSFSPSQARPDRHPEVSPLSPRRSKAVAALSGLAGMSGFTPGAAAPTRNAAERNSGPLSGAGGSASAQKAKGSRGRKAPASNARRKKKSTPQKGKRKHGSGPAHKPGANGTENVGRWTTDEHDRFLKGLEIFQKDWKNIAALVGTRTVVQVGFSFFVFYILNSMRFLHVCSVNSSTPLALLMPLIRAE